MRKILSMILVLLLVASLFVACQDDPETPVDTSGEGTTTNDTAEDTTEGTTTTGEGTTTEGTTTEGTTTEGTTTEGTTTEGTTTEGTTTEGATTEGTTTEGTTTEGTTTEGSETGTDGSDDYAYPSYLELDPYPGLAYDDVTFGNAKVSDAKLTSITIAPGSVIKYSNGWIGFQKAISKFGYRLSKTEAFTWVEGSAAPENGTAVNATTLGGPNAARFKNVTTEPFAEEGTFTFEFGVMLEDGSIGVIQSMEVTVKYPVFIDPTASAFQKGTDITFSVSSKNIEGKDWVGIYKKGEVPGEGEGTSPSIAYFYTNSGLTAFVPGKAAVENTYYVNRTEDNALAVGEYTIYLFENDTFTILAQADITITESVPEYVVDFSKISGNTQKGHPGGYQGWIAYINPGESVNLGSIDLSKYSKMVVRYGADANADFTGTPVSIFGLKSAAGSYGVRTQNTEYDLNNNIAYGECIDTTGAWEAGKVSMEVDLTNVTYNGEVFLTWFATRPIDGVAVDYLKFVP